MQENQKLNYVLFYDLYYKESECPWHKNFDLTYYNKNKILIFIKELENLYKSFGYNQIEISFFINDSQDSNLKSVDLNIKINEGSISKINKVSFIGN